MITLIDDEGDYLDDEKNNEKEWERKDGENEEDDQKEDNEDEEYDALVGIKEREERKLKFDKHIFEWANLLYKINRIRMGI